VRARLAAAAAAGVLVLACRTALPPAVPLAPDDPRPAARLAGLAARSAALEGLRGLARLSVDGPGGSLRSRQVVVAERPDRLRVEVLGFLSQTLAVLVTDGREYSLFDVRDHTFERAALRPGLLEQIAGVDLAPDEAIRVLLGVPDLAGLVPVGAALLPDGGVRIVLADPGGSPRRAVETDADGELQRYASWGPGGRYDARYGDRQPVGDTPFAHRIEIDFPESEVRAQIELSRVDLNPVLGPATFELDTPATAGSGR
jgi:hypothetical protein